MSNKNKQFDSAASEANDQSLADDALDQVSGGLGQDGNDLLIWNNGDGSDFSREEVPSELNSATNDGDAASSDPEWKYVNVRR